jgi:crotonobetainyl-CoA:carnitine CoA-transferase CaiB-like acyl-CoA transferase
MLKPLSDIRVLDLTHVWFGPWCTMMLADLGAEVIRIEPPWGAIDRLAEGALFGGSSYTFHHLNLNKKDLTLDLKTPEGNEIFKKLVEKSDIVIQNFSPGTMERLDLGYDVLKEINPKIIYAALSGFGQNGPYTHRKSYAPIAEAMSGHTMMTGENHDPNGPPIDMAQSYGDLGPGTMAAMTIIAAIRFRDKTEKGQMIDVAQLDCMVAYNTAITGYLLSGLRSKELREKFPRGRGIGGIFKTKDEGWIRIAAFGPRFLDSIAKELKLEIDDITTDLIKEMVSKMNRKDAVEYFVNLGLPCAPILHVDETVADPHVNKRDMFVEVHHPQAGKLKLINFPVKLSETPVEIRSAAPLLGQHNKELLKKILNYNEDHIKDLMMKGVISYSE